VNIAIIVALILIEPVVMIIALILYRRYYYKHHLVRATAPITRPRAAPRPDVPGWVYEIVDPDTGATVYVGQSTQVEKRIDQYLQAALSTGLLYAWMAQKLEYGQRPIVRLVTRGSNRNELARMERERIATHLSAGTKLFNQQLVNPTASRLARYITFERPQD
jgi:GIY-YIG catalytic domain